LVPVLLVIYKSYNKINNEQKPLSVSLLLEMTKQRTFQARSTLFGNSYHQYNHNQQQQQQQGSSANMSSSQQFMEQQQDTVERMFAEQTSSLRKSAMALKDVCPSSLSLSL
jgi:hypothetical protein